MKYFFSIFLLIGLTSCANINTSNIAPGYTQAYSALKQYFTGFQNTIEPQVIKNIPYASMLVKIGNGPTALMILESKNNDDYSWVSADGVYLIINNGKIIKTHGLSNNLNETLTPSIIWSDDLYDNKDFVSYRSFSLPTLNNLKVISSYSKNTPSDVELMFTKKKLTLIEEQIHSKEVGWSALNQYWVDDSNFVWKSVQNISPRLPEVHIEVTKKPL
ncbi:MAG: YjbF family lipoprotein [Gammaproteobacteria bacterium]|tara:strand:+ start:1229 stop:1879 length:651 start_codon:yes stop_codon:yes gene_type:complete